MTEHTPFGGLAVADPRTAAQPVEYDDSGEDNRRKLAVVGAAVTVLVVLVAAFFLLKGKSGDDTAAPTAANATPTGTHAGTAAAPAKPVTLPKTFKGVIGRDPFKALYVETQDAGSGTETSPESSTANPSTGTTTVPVDSTAPGTTTTPTTGSTGTTTTPVVRPIWIKLTKLTAATAYFEVGFSDHKNLTVKKYKIERPTPSKPEVFAQNFALLRASAGSVVLQYGDGTPFVLDEQHPVMIVN